MAHYSIFIPGVKGANDQHLTKVGLGGLLRAGEPGPTWTEVIGRGPNGSAGMIATWTIYNKPEADPILGYYSDRQTWTECRQFWFGIENDRPPLPADLQYRRTIGGQRILLADEQYWLVPHATRLPHKHALDKTTGKWVRVPAARYRRFYDRTQANMVLMFEALDLQDWLEGRVKTEELPNEPVRFTVSDGADFCCEALAINYRLTPEIIDCLELLDDRTMTAIFWTTMEMQEILEVREEKKSAQYVDIPVGMNT